MSIKLKLSLLVSLIIVGVVGALSAVLIYSESRRIQEDLQVQAGTLTRSFAQVCRESLLSHDDIIPINYIKLFLKDRRDLQHAVFVRANGVIQAHTDPSAMLETWKDGGGRSLSQVVVEEVRKDVVDTRGQSAAEGVPVTVVSVPVVTSGHQPEGVVQIGFSQADWNRSAAEQLGATRMRILWVAVIVLAVGIGAAAAFAWAMARPIQRLAEGAKALGAGRLDYRIDIKGKDELAQLAGDFNEMGQKLQEFDEMKGNFVSSISHELRSPLTAIKGYVEQLLKDRAGKLTDSQREYLTIVKNNTARLNGFINDILDLAKIEAKQLELRYEAVQIRTLVDELVTLYKFQAEEKSVTLLYRIPSSLPFVKMDQDKIRQVFTNLLSNALKFTPELGTVSITVEEKGRELVCHVADTGLGIPKEDQPYIFDKFRQSQSVQSRAKTVKGTGLGLAIVKGIIEAHGGKIWVVSQVDHGTTFSFTLPVVGS